MASTIVQQANTLINERRYDEAVTLLEPHLADGKHDGAALNMLAFAHYSSADYARAEGIYRRLVALPDSDSRAKYSLGRTLQQLGKDQEAQVWIDAAAAENPKFQPVPTDRSRLGGGAPSAIGDSARARDAQMSDLSIPRDEELEDYTRRRRARSKEDWWTENWYSIPWGVRLAQIIGLLAFLAFMVWLVAGS